jgi:uncharacterized protein YqgV (UPF0045/DUF77 family)
MTMMMKKKTINLAIQVLPTSSKKHPYAIVDEAIAVIKEAGIPYIVCPFETVIEAPYDEAMDIAKKVQEACYEAGAEADALPLSYSRMIECKNTNYLNMLSFVSPEINQYPISQNVLICLRK